MLIILRTHFRHYYSCILPAVWEWGFLCCFWFLFWWERGCPSHLQCSLAIPDSSQQWLLTLLRNQTQSDEVATCKPNYLTSCSDSLACICYFIFSSQTPWHCFGQRWEWVVNQEPHVGNVCTTDEPHFCPKPHMWHLIIVPCFICGSDFVWFGDLFLLCSGLTPAFVLWDHWWDSGIIHYAKNRSRVICRKGKHLIPCTDFLAQMLLWLVILSAL